MKQNCNAMMEKVSKWSKSHAGKVRACYAVPRGADVGLFFVPKTNAFDFDLADELADLNRNLMRRFKTGTVEIHQVPADEVERFIVLDEARQVYSDTDLAHLSGLRDLPFGIL
jgi:hypothetical protein